MMNVIGSFAKKKLRIFCFQKHCNWQSSSKCPGLNINTVMKEGAKGKIARKEEAKRCSFIFIYISFPLLALWYSPSYSISSSLFSLGNGC